MEGLCEMTVSLDETPNCGWSREGGTNGYCLRRSTVPSLYTLTTVGISAAISLVLLLVAVDEAMFKTHRLRKKGAVLF